MKVHLGWSIPLLISMGSYAVQLEPVEQEVTAGYFTVRLAQPASLNESLSLTVSKIGQADSHVSFSLAMPAQQAVTLSGFAQGDYQLTLNTPHRVLSHSRVRVRHHPPVLAYGLFALGAALFLLLVGFIWRANAQVEQDSAC
ncbi:hypothetical protein [Pseudoalteromonas rubra]|uniref:hypothetical protein n=1 Tax=Pseudoalteromonas rubra TaxID=43658 RepID=UPI002DB64B2D|nr:hypothetical protein [Pseudoalteromonas rubra]MEC4090240.1 hypothetical protein [Pseudoalteromonas rubra]